MYNDLYCYFYLKFDVISSLLPLKYKRHPRAQWVILKCPNWQITCSCRQVAAGRCSGSPDLIQFSDCSCHPGDSRNWGARIFQKEYGGGSGYYTVCG